MKKLFLLLTAILFFVLLPSMVSATVRYVTPTGAGTFGGTSWANASYDLQLTINNSSSGDEIWVAAGTYKPNRKADALGTIAVNDRNNAFVLKTGVKIYGGFAGTETLLSQRNWTRNVTILSGDLGAIGTITDNAYHVVVSSGDPNLPPDIENGPSVLDGFTINNGNASDWNSISVNGNSISQNSGGGIFCYSSSPILSNLILSNNYAQYGGGICNSTSSSPSITGVTLTFNSAVYNGGGMRNIASSSPTMTNVTINNNIVTAAWSSGGGMYNESASNPIIINALIYKNDAAGNGGAMYSYDTSSPTLTNATIAYNTTSEPNGWGAGPGICMAGTGTGILRNCIIWGNKAAGAVRNVDGPVTYSYTLLEGGTVSGTTIISNSNPLFRNTSTDDYHLTSETPADDVGNNTYIGGVSTDLDGLPRIYNTTVDLGAYEFPPITRYVTPTGAGTGTGASWANASSDLQLMINNSNTGDCIWVAAGTYKPNRRADALGTIATDNRNNAFVLKSGVKIYGGFAGSETLLSQRDWATNVTTLSGDLGTGGVTTDNAYHVVISAGAVGTAELNGFTVTGGNAINGSNPTVNSKSIASGFGGGVYCVSSSPVLSNLKIQSNSAQYDGGGIYNSSSSPTITGVTLVSNSAINGAGMCNTSSSPIITNIIIQNNNATVQPYGKGGGIFNDNSSIPIITNALIFKNTSAQDGAGICNSDKQSKPTLTNVTLVYNTAANAYVGGISGDATIKNSIIWGNKGGSTSNNVSGSFTYSYTLLEGGTVSGTSIISNSYPAFTDISTDNYHLKRMSPVVNKGLNSLNNSSTDLDGNVRIFDSANGGVIDLGAYEYQSADATVSPFTNGIMYVKKGASGNGTSWADAIGELSDALSIASGSSFVTQIWVAAGTYYPGYLAGNGTTDRDKAFILLNNIKIYGGFAGTESTIDSRNLNANASILSGDLGTIGNTADNAFHVVVSSGAVGTAELNGFTITDGRAINSVERIVNSNAIKSSWGGGVFCTNSSPILSNLIVKSNYAEYLGGGIYNFNSSPILTNLLICNNTSGQGGAGINNNSSTLTIINSTISNNNAGGYTGGIDGGCIVKNSIIYGNTGTNVNGTFTYSNTLLQGGTVSSPSIISNSNPQFVNSATGDFRITTASPAKDAGNNSYVSGISVDLDGLARIYNTTVDLGAYELAPAIRYVTPTGAGTGTGTSWANASSDLQLMINNSNPDDQIWVASGTYKPNRKADALGTITSNNKYNAFVLRYGVKIYGGFAGTETFLTQRNWVTNVSTLSGDINNVGDATDNTYHVVISSGAVGTAELNGFTIRDGYAVWNNQITVNGINVNANNGGGIACYTSSPNLSNCTITSNTASEYGGGMYNISSSAPVLTNVIIQSNSAQINGGGIYNDASSPSLTGVTIVSNSAIGSSGGVGGGGMFNKSNSSPTLTGVTLNLNSAPNGGGMYNTSSSPILSNCTIASNTASEHGGGMYNLSSSSPVLTNVIIQSNSAQNNGGGIYNDASSPTITRVTIDSNSAKNEGGGVYNISSSSPTITNSIIRNNFTVNDWTKGGGIYNKTSSNPTITNSLIYKNSSHDGGAGIFNDGGSPTLKNTTIVYNTMRSSGGTGGGVSGSMTLQNCVIWGNKANTTTNNVHNSLTYTNTLVEGVSGAGIISSSNPLFVDASTDNYRLTRMSPAINRGSNALNTTLTDLDENSRIFDGGIIDLGAYEYQSADVFGPDANGILYVKKGSSGTGNSWVNAIGELSEALLMTNGLSSVTQIWVAAGTYFPADIAGNGTTDRDKAFVLINNIKIYGGFAGTETTLSQRNINANGTILSGDLGTINNTSDDCYHVVISAGSIGTACLDGFTITKGNANVSSNITVNSQTVSQANGGGIHFATSSPNLSNCTIISNNASGKGGGMYNASSSPILENVKIQSNSSGNDGGGMMNESSSPSLTNVTIVSNTAAWNGAGMFNSNSSPTIINAIITNNTSSRSGGGICNKNWSSPTFKNALIYKNTCSEAGGGVFDENSTSTIINATIVYNNGNQGNGGGVFGNSILKNSVIWGNRISGSINNVSGTQTYSNTLLQGGTIGAGIISNSDPLFVNPAVDDYRLGSNSPAIDQGNDALYPMPFTTATDLAGKPRKMGNAIDLGAYEYIVNEWTGLNSVDWSTTSNWTDNRIPNAQEDIRFNESAVNNLSLTESFVTGSVVNHTARSLIINGQSLTVQNSFDFGTNARIDATLTGSVFIFGGSSSQSIASNIFLNDGVYNLTIDNTAGVTVNTDFTVNNLLTINAGKLLTIPVSKKLNVQGTITNNAGSGGLVIKSSSSDANGTLIFHNTVDNPVYGTVEMYSKAFYDSNGPAGSKYKWQYFGIPVRSLTANPTFYGSYLRQYNEPGLTSADSWLTLNNSSVLTSFKGYEMTQTSPKTLYFQGILENADMNYNLTHNADSWYKGQHIISNPYTAAINISELNFTNMEAAIYLYNTGSHADWVANSGITIPGISPGQYVAAPKMTSGSGGIPDQIPSMQGFMVTANLGDGSLNFPYSSFAVKNLNPQRVRKSATAEDKIFTIIDVQGSRYNDKMWLFSDPACTHSFDNGWDGFKIFGSSLAPQICAIEADGNYQINAVDNIDNTDIGFKAGEDSNYTLTFNHQNMDHLYSALYLVDLLENKTIDISESGSTYTFTSNSASASDKRFRIVTNPNISTELEEDSMKICPDLKVYSSKQTIYIENNTAQKGDLTLYDSMGRIVDIIPFNATKHIAVPTKLKGGMYLVKAFTAKKTVVVSLVLP